MSKWFKQFISIAKNSFVVMISDPLSLIILLLIIGLIFFIASLPGFTIGGQIRLVREQILALTFICTALLASVGAARIVGEDIRKGMIPTILSRPVSASALLAGKWFGLLISLGMIFFISTIAALWATRLVHHEHSVEILGMIFYLGVTALALSIAALHHYLRGGNYIWQSNILIIILFPLAFLILNFFGYNGGEHGSAAYGSLVDWKSAYAFIFLFMALTVFSSMVVFFSVLMDISMLMAFAVIIFFTGLFSQYILGLITVSPVIRAVMSIFTPDWQMFWVSEILSDTSLFNSGFFLSHLTHALFQSVFFIILAAIFFDRKEISGTV